MRKPIRAVAAATLAIAVVSCSSNSEEIAQEPSELEATDTKVLAVAKLASSDGEPRGQVTMQNDGGSLSLDLDLSGLEPGEKAFHLHAIGDCTSADFKSAGGHLNPFGNTHGSQSENGQHLGDFPNISVDPNGSAKAVFPIEGDTDRNIQAIMDDDGTAVMVHAGPDDYKSDPAGAAGSRIACGVLAPMDAL